MPNSLKYYLQLIKPGMVAGNLISVAGGFLLAARGCADMWLLLQTTTGTSLVIASACVFNNWIDRRIDRKMSCTRHRVLAREGMSPAAAVVYATILGISGITLLWMTTCLLSVAIVAAGFTIYVVVYSLWLKRTSVYSTIVGSLAGAAPPLAGYCAVTQRFDLGALILLAIFSLWQMPHSYAVALFRFKDYAAAAIPVMPISRGVANTRKQIMGYIPAFTVAASLLTFSGYTGYRYLAVTTTMGILWLGLAWSGYQASERRWARRLFIFSLASITVLSVMMAIDGYTPPSGSHTPVQSPTCAMTESDSASLHWPFAAAMVSTHPGP